MILAFAAAPIGFMLLVAVAAYLVAKATTPKPKTGTYNIPLDDGYVAAQGRIFGANKLTMHSND